MFNRNEVINKLVKRSMQKQNKYRWLLLGLIILAFFIIPFIFIGDRIDIWTENLIQTADSQPVFVATVISFVIASDILLPIPANEANTAASYFLGFMGGFISAFTGRTLACIIGYWLGRKLGRSIIRKLAGYDELKQVEEMNRRFGDWIIVLFRTVPVLAEVSVLLAGIGEMPIKRFLLLTTVANLGISAVFSAVGAFSATVNSFLLAFSSSILISLIVIVLINKGKIRN